MADRDGGNPDHPLAWRHTLQTRLALFYMDRQDQQVKGSYVIPRDDGSNAFIDYTNNAARGNNYGAEIELDWIVSERLSIYANVGLLETEFEEYINADGITKISTSAQSAISLISLLSFNCSALNSRIFRK